MGFLPKQTPALGQAYRIASRSTNQTKQQISCRHQLYDNANSVPCRNPKKERKVVTVAFVTTFYMSQIWLQPSSKIATRNYNKI